MTEKRAEDSDCPELDGRKIEMKKARGDSDDLQAERGGLKVKDSDFKTE